MEIHISQILTTDNEQKVVSENMVMETKSKSLPQSNLGTTNGQKVELQGCFRLTIVFLKS